MRLIDLHCDTLYRAYQEKGSLFQNDFHISFEKSRFLKSYIQCMAIWIPDEYRGETAERLFDGCVKKLHEQIDNSFVTQIMHKADLADSLFKTGVILTVESGAALAGKIENVRRFYDCGVRMMTLTWNGTNELGDGIGVAHPKGLSDFGKEAVAVMEKTGIIVDVSHASEALFYDVAQQATKPVCASHSNLRSICSHPRNLTDEQFKFIRDGGGIVGINFCRDFLSENGTNAKMYDIIKITDAFLSLGGEKTVAFGGDFDGCDIPDNMSGLESTEKLYTLFVRHGYNETLLDDLFFNNAYRFFVKNMAEKPFPEDEIKRKRDL